MIKKIGNNELCPCKSGKKFKRCCSSKRGQITDDTRQILLENEALEYQRKEQQGSGKRIISTVHNGSRVVAVGHEIFHSKDWKTFNNFLYSYIKKVLGENWGNSELKKPIEDQHEILQWYRKICEHQAKYLKVGGEISSMPMTGAASAYLGLAYNLYLLVHNPGIQAELIKRLKNKDQFRGALYETYVAANFVKAGFDLEFENESDGSISHCEFTATYRETGRKFSVEAKARDPNMSRSRIGQHLNKALKKDALHERVIFIDIGKEARTPVEARSVIFTALKNVRRIEKGCCDSTDSTSSAYVVLTNNPYWCDLDGTNFQFSALLEGFKIPDLKYNNKLTMEDALSSEHKHAEILTLADSIKYHRNIPTTFDGQDPGILFVSIAAKVFTLFRIKR